MWWIGQGTVLGLWRDGGFIKGDTDIDIRIGLDYRYPQEARDYMAYVIGAFEQEGFTLVREMYWDRRPTQTAFLDTLNNNLEFDIYYFYRNLTEGCYVSFNDIGYREKPAHLIENRRRVGWPAHPDIVVNVPYPIESYIEWRFGPEWRVPKRRSQYTSIDRRCLRRLPKGTVLTYGTFDIFHAGHARLLRRAAALGDKLVVGIVSDELCRINGGPIVNSDDRRAEVIAASGHVDAVFIQRDVDQMEKDIDRFAVRRLVVGDDCKNNPRFEQVRGYHGCELIYLPQTEWVPASILLDQKNDPACQAAK